MTLNTRSSSSCSSFISHNYSNWYNNECCCTKGQCSVKKHCQIRLVRSLTNTPYNHKMCIISILLEVYYRGPNESFNLRGLLLCQSCCVCWYIWHYVFSVWVCLVRYGVERCTPWTDCWERLESLKSSDASLRTTQDVQDSLLKVSCSIYISVWALILFVWKLHTEMIIKPTTL